MFDGADAVAPGALVDEDRCITSTDGINSSNWLVIDGRSAQGTLVAASEQWREKQTDGVTRNRRRHMVVVHTKIKEKILCYRLT